MRRNDEDVSSLGERFLLFTSSFYSVFAFIYTLLLVHMCYFEALLIRLYYYYIPGGHWVTLAHMLSWKRYYYWAGLY